MLRDYVPAVIDARLKTNKPAPKSLQSSINIYREMLDGRPSRSASASAFARQRRLITHAASRPAANTYALCCAEIEAS